MKSGFRENQLLFKDYSFTVWSLHRLGKISFIVDSNDPLFSRHVKKVEEKILANQAF